VYSCRDNVAGLSVILHGSNLKPDLWAEFMTRIVVDVYVFEKVIYVKTSLFIRSLTSRSFSEFV